MIKIIIVKPTKKDPRYRLQRRFKWKGRRYVSPTSVLARLERSLSRYRQREKTCVTIREVYPYQKGRKTHLSNESLPSDNPNYLIWITACFLEDDLRREVFNKYERKYSRLGQTP